MPMWCAGDAICSYVHAMCCAGDTQDVCMHIMQGLWSAISACDHQAAATKLSATDSSVWVPHNFMVSSKSLNVGNYGNAVLKASFHKIKNRFVWWV